MVQYFKTEIMFNEFTQDFYSMMCRVNTFWVSILTQELPDDKKAQLLHNQLFSLGYFFKEHQEYFKLFIDTEPPPKKKKKKDTATNDEHNNPPRIRTKKLSI